MLQADVVSPSPRRTRTPLWSSTRGKRCPIWAPMSGTRCSASRPSMPPPMPLRWRPGRPIPCRPTSPSKASKHNSRPRPGRSLRRILSKVWVWRYSQTAMLILASASPRRHELLSQAGLAFTVETSDINEDRLPHEIAAAYVQRLAEEKAQAVWALRRSADTPDDPLIVLGADTCVVSDGHILGKPTSADDARRMLQRLSGRTHAVLTGIAAASRGKTISDVEITQVTFNIIKDSEIDEYVATGEPLDKAGAYAIQGYAARWIPRIEGCYFNVVGLPIARTITLLDEVRAKLR